MDYNVTKLLRKEIDVLRSKKNQSKAEIEINDYITANKGISYYDVMIYAYDNDMESWIDLLKHSKFKSALSSTLRDYQIELGMFNVRLDKELKLCHEAEIRYSQRHRSELQSCC